MVSDTLALPIRRTEGDTGVEGERVALRRYKQKRNERVLRLVPGRSPGNVVDKDL